jgi:nitrogen fixation negative regulator NifL
MQGRRQEPGHNGSAAAALEEAVRKGREALDTLRACIPDEAEEAIATVDLNAILQDVLRLSAPRFLISEVAVAWQPASGLPTVGGRVAQLTALFKQLVDNAVDALGEVQTERRRLMLSTTAHSDRVEVVVEDTGPGIPEEWHLKVFEPFFTTKGANEQHLGMGLAVAQEVVARHGGIIGIDPDYHDGCRVRVQLPVGGVGT